MSKLNPEPFKSNKNSSTTVYTFLDQKKVNIVSEKTYTVQEKVIYINFNSNSEDPTLLDAYFNSAKENGKVTGTFDWGDGTILDIDSDTESSVELTMSHTYAEAGIYRAVFTINEVEDIDAITINNSTQVIGIDGNWIVFNNLVELNISGMTNLSVFTFKKDTFRKLESLVLTSTGIKELDLSIPMPKLENLDLRQNGSLVSFTISKNPSRISGINLNACHLPVAQINALLIYLDSQTYDLSSHSLLITQTVTATPTGAGATAKTSLEGKGWSINSSSPSS
jgi:PKD repeat protein